MKNKLHTILSLVLEINDNTDYDMQLDLRSYVKSNTQSVTVFYRKDNKLVYLTGILGVQLKGLTDNAIHMGLDNLITELQHFLEVNNA